MKQLCDELIQYGQGGDYPYHMPGHKRRMFGELPSQLFQMDITEIDGFDNLHDPQGILLELQERIAALYGAKESFCLVGGSTAGILSAVSCALCQGDRILMARNSHRSAYHAAYLRNLQISYLYPNELEPFSIADHITPEQVDEALTEHEDIGAVFLVSPTYEGRISPIGEIAERVHAHGKLLIVDEAHGAHLVLTGDGTLSSTRAGADLVIHSIHKTLPALTQTALLHVCSERVDGERLKRFLRIYQSSSPSYLLMAGVDNCITLMEREGHKLYQTFCLRFRRMVQSLIKCENIRILATECGEGEAFSAKRQDVGKLLLFPAPGKMTGRQLYDLLRETYRLQLEMAAETFCLAMFTVCDTPEGFARFQEAVLAIDAELSGREPALEEPITEPMEEPITEPMAEPITEPIKEPVKGYGGSGNRQSEAHTGAETGMTLTEAWDHPARQIPLAECVGRVCAEFINLYPPGTPILVPGEIVTEEIRDRILHCQALGLNVQGLSCEGACLKCVCTLHSGKSVGSLE